MKTTSLRAALGAILGVSAGAHAAPVLFANGDFEAPGGAPWHEVGDGVTWDYPATGGNPGGYGVIDAGSGQWGIWVNDADTPVSLDSLGLTAGKTYTFAMDMRIEPGSPASNIGGLKIESWAGGLISDSDNVYPALVGDGSGWESYSFTYTIAAGATGIKVVPLWGPGSSVGFDNIRVDDTPVEPPPVVPVIPNGGFEIPAGANWSYFTDGFGLSWPATGGNPGGNAVIDATLPGTYGVLVANDNVPQTLASLGLTAGETYTFQLDMKVLSGTNPGGLKVEFVPTASENRPTAGDIAALPNPVTEWNTYSFDITLPAPCTRIQVVPLWGPGSVVAYDNVRILLPTPPGAPRASIARGTAVGWTPASALNGYQPQGSPDGSAWTNVGPMIVGDTVTSVFDRDARPFHRVLESVPAARQSVFNGGFEEPGLDEFAASGWSAVQTQPATRVLTDSRTGAASMQIKVANAAADPNGSEIQQNTRNSDPDNGSITPGNSYDLSFWARQVSSGVSYVQQFKVTWLDGIGAITGDGGFRVFSAPVGGPWTEITQSGLVAPAGTESALIQILGVTGAVAGGEGEVLIDDVSLLSSGFGSPTPIAAAAAPAVEVSWPSRAGRAYQVRASDDLDGWSDPGPVISGDGTTKSVFEPVSGRRRFYQVAELP